MTDLNYSSELPQPVHGPSVAPHPHPLPVAVSLSVCDARLDLESFGVNTAFAL